MNGAQWADANTRYMCAAVAWVRALLRERDKRARAAESEMSEIAASASPAPALLTLAQSLGLSAFERNVLLLCAATDLDTSVAALCGEAQGTPSRPYPTFALALTLFEDAAWDAISPERPLRYWRLIEISQPGATPLTVSAMRADERIVNLLKGVTYVDDRLTPLLAPIPDPGDGVPASQRATADAIVEQLRIVQPGAVPAVQLLGADGDSKQIVASLVCGALALRPYRLDWRLLPAVPADVDSLARLLQRESVLLPVAVYLDTEGSESAHSAAIDMLLARLAGGLVFVGTRHLRPVTSGAPIAADVAKPSAPEQREVWAAALGDAAGDIPDALAAQFNLNAATIRDIALRATGDTGSAALRERVWETCRALTRPRLDTLAHRVDARATWDDIVLPASETALLRQVADQVAQRGTVYRTWGFGERTTRGLGISVLFSGTSGSGKTLAAEVMANHLRLDLFRIDLSAVMSKYIGETEANLRRLFDAAEDGGAILFFDEADALFGKRSEVKDSHDRYANIEINYLLQRMESYSGVAILATNMKGALDPAFMRRLRFVVEFPFPNAADRKTMWQKSFPAGTPVTRLDFDRLAKLNLTGGSIAVIVLNAAFTAAHAGTAVSMRILLDAARVELTKLGTPINERDFQLDEPAGAVA